MAIDDFPMFSPPGWPEDTIGFFSSDGKPLACIKGVVPAGTPAPSVFGPLHDGFRQHLDRTIRDAEPVKISYVPITPDNFDERLGSIEDELREKIAKRHERQVLDSLNTTTTTQAPSEPLDLGKLMADIDDMLAKKLEMDKTLIRALLDAGIDIEVNERTGRPRCIMPKDMARAVAEVRKERGFQPAATFSYLKGTILS